MATITPELRRAIEEAGGLAVRLEDPQTHKSYVLLEAETYDRVQALVELGDDLHPGDWSPHAMKVFGRAGWDDPIMDEYNDLDPRRES